MYLNQDIDLEMAFGFIRAFNQQPEDALTLSLRQEAATDHIPIITQDVEAFMTFLIKLLRPQRVLEVGTAIGYSARCFLQADPQLQVDTIEIDPQMIKRAQKCFEQANLNGRVRILPGDANTVLPGLKRVYDLVFIDAAKTHYQSFFEEALELTRPGGIIACDNVLYRGKVLLADEDVRKKHRTTHQHMKSFLSYLKDLPQPTILLPFGDGLSLTQMAVAAV